LDGGVFPSLVHPPKVGPGDKIAIVSPSFAAPAVASAVHEAYGEATHLAHALPAASVQALLSWAFEDDPDDAAEWVTRLAEAARRI
jgi:ABC-type nitrate/sulfonate/bicarbonate transport system substrate-binding protein